MACTKTDFPPVRACIFDMDGLLINSEDIITSCLNKTLAKHGRQPIPRAIRVQLMGIPDSTNSDTLHHWAELPISRSMFKEEMSKEMSKQFMNCEPLRGAERLLKNLSRATGSASGHAIRLALASSSTADSYQLKSSRPDTGRLLGMFDNDKRILGSDKRVGKDRGKPAPDIYLVALEALRSITGSEGTSEIQPEECLVFEDSVIGVEAGRRAGMRVIWVPHQDVAAELQDMIKEVLAARSGMSGLGEDWQLGEIDDGWAECISSLDQFDYDKYGIRVPPEAYQAS